MDQSKPDFQVRLHCLNLAVSLGVTNDNDPDYVSKYAREFYLFLTSQDPVVDLKSTSSNVISIAEFSTRAEVDTDTTH